jgi:hypothetical protein
MIIVEALFGFPEKESLLCLTERIMKMFGHRVHPEYIMNENLPGIETLRHYTSVLGK